ncbi:MAG: NAD-dependent epimerase/dehydratase family protein, partial [Flammeovirgaceae bacterium]
AIHREPGHQADEYFETNLKGAENVCKFAEKIDCKNIFFTSSIAVYGLCIEPTDESKRPCPITPYGGSKYPAELIHQMWQNRDLTKRRLIISRPGVIFGPGDPGNIFRMIKAVKKGYFAFPGSPEIHKSYAYIFGFMESIQFMMNRHEKMLIYNYVETPTQSIREIVEITKKTIGSRAPIISIPPWVLLFVSSILLKVYKKSNSIHPIRVKKAGTPTHIVP